MKRPAKRLALQPRDQELLLSIYEEFREATLRVLCRRHFPDCRSETSLRRSLNRLLQAGFLTSRRVQVLGEPGRGSHVYLVGRGAAVFIAHALGIPVEEVNRCIRQASRLGDFFLPHRSLITDARLSLAASCELHGYSLVEWTSDEDFRQRGEQVIMNGVRAFVFPDAYCVIRAGDRTAPLFIEAQLRSKPSHYRRKAALYRQYIDSGSFTRNLGHKSIRILGVTDTRERARNLKLLADSLPDAGRYWSAGIEDIRADAVGEAVWFVGGLDSCQPLMQ